MVFVDNTFGNIFFAHGCRQDIKGVGLDFQVRRNAGAEQLEEFRIQAVLKGLDIVVSGKKEWNMAVDTPFFVVGMILDSCVNVRVGINGVLIPGLYLVKVDGASAWLLFCNPSEARALLK